MATQDRHHAVPHHRYGETLPEEAEYYEISTAQAVPTKTGDDAIMSDGSSIDGRPVSAGTFSTTALEIDDSQEDEALLLANTVTPVSGTEAAHTLQTVDFKKPDASAVLADVDYAADFSFPKATPASTEHARVAEEDTADSHQPQELDSGEPQEQRPAQPEEVQEYESYDIQPVEESPARPVHHILPRRVALQPISSWPTWHLRAAQYIDRKRHKASRRRDQLHNVAVQAVVHYPVQPEVPVPTVLTLANTADSGSDNQNRNASTHPTTGEDAGQTERENSGSSTAQQLEPVPIPLDDQRVVGHQHSVASEASGMRPKDTQRDTANRRLWHENPRSYPSRNVSTRFSSSSYESIHNDGAQKMREKDEQVNARFAKFEDELKQVKVEKRGLEETVENVRKEADEKLAMANSASEQLQQELAKAAQEKTGLTQEVKDLRKKVNGAQRLQKFVEGLGRDFEEMKNASRRLTDRAIEDCREFKAQHDLVAEELRKGLAREGSLSASVRASAAALRETNLKLKQAIDIGAVDRDRREQAESQLLSAIQSNEDVQRAIQSSSDEILGRLSTIHTILNDGNKDSTISDMLQQAMQDIRGIDSGTVETADRITTIKSSVEELVEKFEEYATMQSKHADSVESPRLENMQAHFDQNLLKLKEDLCQTEKLLQQDAEHRETISALREQLKTSQLRCDKATSQVTTAQQVENELRQSNAALQMQLTALKSSSTPGQEAQVQLNSVNIELETVKLALQTAEAELSSKSEELCALGPANNQLTEQLQALQMQLEGLKIQTADFGREREELLRKARENEQSIRQEMREHVETVELQVRAETKNELKKSQSERNRLNDQVSSLQNDLDSANSKFNQLRQDWSRDTQSTQESDRTKKCIKLQQQEIEALKASLTKAQNAVEDYETLKEQHATISAQLNAETSKLEAAQTEVSVLKDKCVQGEVSCKASEKDAIEAKEDAQRSRAGLEHYKASCKQAIDDATSKGERHAEALQKSLSEAHAELEAAKTAGAKFRTEVENSWKQEQESYDERISQLRHKLAESEQQRHEIQTNFEQIQAQITAVETERSASIDQLNEMIRRAEVAEASLKDMQASTELLDEMRQRAEVAEADLKAVHANLETLRSATTGDVPNGLDDTTPVNTLRAIQPTKPRKILNRNTGLVSEVGRIPTPDILRPDSRRTGSAGSRHEPRQLHTGETQSILDVQTSQHFEGMESIRSSLSPGVDPILKIRGEAFSRPPSIVEETQLNNASQPQVNAFPRPPAVVEETQLDYGSRSSSRQVPYPPSVVEETQLGESYATRSAKKAWPLSFQEGHSKRRASNTDFTIYEDSVERGAARGSQDSMGHGILRDSLSWTQSERDMYTFQKPVANPNSASKRGPAPAGMSSNDRRSTSFGGMNGTSGLDRATTPYQPNALNRNGSNLSSSPHFVQNSQNGRKQNTYQAAGSSAAKRRPSRTSSNTVADPRLAGRNSIQKRKAEMQPPAEPSAPAVKRQALASLPSDSYGQPPKRSSSHFPSMSLEPPRTSQNSSNTAHDSSHMRTLAGTMTRQTRSAKKMSKDDEFSARFSQEFAQPSRRLR